MTLTLEILAGYAAINILAIAFFAMRYFLVTRAYRRRYQNNVIPLRRPA